ncbi:MAG: long-chain-fatty-acid--CoA ligase [Solirubrobacterales bacterium]
MTNFATQLESAAAEEPERIAVKLDDIEVDYATLNAASTRVAGLLQERGIGAGDRVALLMPNVPYFPMIYFGALRIGAIVVPLNPLLRDREIEYHLSDSGSKILFGWSGFDDSARPGAEAAGVEYLSVAPGDFEGLLAAVTPVVGVTDREDGDGAVIIYTSGTTGKPKGATLTHSNLSTGARVGCELVNASKDSVAIATLPLFHVFGMNSVMNVAVHARGTLTLIPRFDPEVALKVIERDRATTFAGVPTMYTAMLNHPEREKFDASSLELCVSGGSALPVEVLRGFDEAFGCKVLEGYGLSESTGMGSFNPPDRERKPGSIGVPIGGTEFRLVDENDKDVPAGERGEVVMRGPFVMGRYWEREEDTESAMQGGWFHTGDIATMDEDGYYFIVDRKKDLIIRGGYNVYPREVEEALYEHPAVREVAVVGIDHDELGQEVGAAVGLKPEVAATPEELRDFIKERVAAYKYPRQIWIVDELPKGPTGKILKREIVAP